MKTKLLFSTLLLIGGSFMAAAQSETRLGAMLAYGTEIESIGIGVNAEIPVMENMTIAPGFIFYFPKDEMGVKVNWWELNANVNYYFSSTESLDFYGLGGLNYSQVKVSYDGINNSMFDGSYNDGRFGLNLGAGANFKIGSSLTPFAEVKYEIIDGGQLVIAAGVKFNI